MADFGTIQTRVQRNIIDLPLAVQAAVPDLINSAMRDLQATVDCLRAFIAGLYPQPLPPEQIRAALAPETENQYEAI